MKNKVIIGKIVNTRGLKGEVKVVNYSDFASLRYQKNKQVYLFDEKKGVLDTLTITSVGFSSTLIFLKFENINSIEEAEKLKTLLLAIDKSELNTLEEDDYYFHELVGLEVFYKNKNIGSIVQIESNFSQDMLRVKKDEKSILIPFFEHFIEKVDLENKKVIAINLEGLL